MIQPAIFIPHGGGPAFFMNGSMHEIFKPMENYLAQLLGSLSEKPRAILIATAHWESDPVAINGLAKPRLLFDYYGFPPDTYHIKYPAAGSPELAREVAALLTRAQIAHRLDEERGWDHGVFIPLKVMVPAADIPVVALSLHPNLDPVLHHQIGEALSPLRQNGVLVIGSGMSFHNLRHFTDSKQSSSAFDGWLERVLRQAKNLRAADLAEWQRAPRANEAHPRSEHLLPLMVCSGCGSDRPALRDWNGKVGESVISAWRFD